MTRPFTTSELEMLERQRAYFSSDECLLARAAAWRDATPEECWEAVLEECAAGDFVISQYSPEIRERALAHEPLPANTLALLGSMQRMS